jgi:asparagine synthase (glutamine-hydrolysing)
MCGICGIIAGKNSPPITEKRLLAMRDIMTYRGPDDAGVHLEESVALGSRRLAILDLSERGHMPMLSPDGRYALVYNGEIYNYLELRAALLAEGRSFRSNTDTEVVLTLYAQMGPEMLDLLNGMFAIAIWDRLDQTLFLARDRSGIKPVFFSLWKDLFYFSSEIKSIHAAGVPIEFDHSVWDELLCFRSLAGSATPYKGIKELIPGHYLLLKSGSFTITRWWNLAHKIWERRERPVADPVSCYRAAFDRSVRTQRISDVPVGVMLSGGLDSSSLAASLAKQSTGHMDSFTVRFQDATYDEGGLAKQVADQWRLNFNELFVDLRDIPALLREASWLNDEPLAHGNELHILAIARLAKSLVTVLLSGEGADETLGGYVRYRPLLLGQWIKYGSYAVNQLDRLFRWQGRWHKLARFMKMNSIDDFILFNSCNVLQNDISSVGLDSQFELEYRRKILAESKEIYPQEPVRQLMYLDLHTFLVSELDRIDRMTMGASIEARVPFLDHRIIELTASLPTQIHFQYSHGKQIIRKAFAERLPKSILSNRKWGFGVPWTQYYRDIPELRELVSGMHKRAPIIDGPLDSNKIHVICDDFLNGNDARSALVIQLAMITIWWEMVRNPRG